MKDDPDAKGGKIDKYGKKYKNQKEFETAAEAWWKEKEKEKKRRGGRRY